MEGKKQGRRVLAKEVRMDGCMNIRCDGKDVKITIDPSVVKAANGTVIDNIMNSVIKINQVTRDFSFF